MSELPHEVTKYFICDKGIFYTENSYYDDVDYHYVVEFADIDCHKQFRTFLKTIFQEGKKARSREIKHLFTGEY